MIAGGPAVTSETLRDGKVVIVRPVRSDDAAGIEGFWRRLDAAARRRFVELAQLAPDDPGGAAVIEPDREAGIIALPEGPATRAVGLARYQRIAADAAQFLVFVDASYRRAGLGKVLVRRLAEAARHSGLRRLVSDVSTNDVSVLRLLADLGLDYEEQATGGNVRSYRLLTGYRNFPVLDVAAFSELLHRVSAMVEDISEIAEIDLNPVFVRPHGAVVGDVRIRLAA